MKKVLIILASAAAVLASCGRGGASGDNRLTVTIPKVSDAPDWTGATADDPPVAHVGGIPIPASRFRRALDKDPENNPQTVLADLIDREVAAQAAVRALDLEEPGDSDRLVWQRALVDVLIDDLFMTGYLEKDIPREHLVALFSVPQIWARFNHGRVFDVQDYQWVCCDGRPANCGQPYARECFTEGAAAMAAVHQALVLARPDAEDLPLLVERYQVSAPRLSYQEYSFAFDEEKGVQRGRVLFDDAVVARVVGTPMGQFAEPVRSRFGWHVLYVRDSVPPESRDLSDPAVRHEIATTFRARLQQMRFLEFMATLVGTHSLTMLRAYFQDRPAPGGKPHYDVDVFLETLREAVEGSAQQQEDQLL